MKTMFEFENENNEMPEEIISADTAERVIKQYKMLKSEIERAQDSADAYLEEAQKKVDNYLVTVVTPGQERLRYMEELLKCFAKKQTALSGKKSVKLIEGTLSFVKSQPKYEKDDLLVVQYIQDLPNGDPLKGFLKPQPPKLDWAALKKEIHQKDGSVYYHDKEIPDITVQENPEDSFRIR